METYEVELGLTVRTNGFCRPMIVCMIDRDREIAWVSPKGEPVVWSKLERHHVSDLSLFKEEV